MCMSINTLSVLINACSPYSFCAASSTAWDDPVKFVLFGPT